MFGGYSPAPEIVDGLSGDGPSSHQLTEIQDISLNFIRTIRRIHGADKAKEVIDSLSDTLGKQWSSQIIFDILTLGPEDIRRFRCTFTCRNFNNGKIQLIKGFRWITGSGLKEAKDAVEALNEKLLVWELAKAAELGLGGEQDLIPSSEYRSAPHFVAELKGEDERREERVQGWRDGGGLFI